MTPESEDAELPSPPLHALKHVNVATGRDVFARKQRVQWSIFGFLDFTWFNLREREIVSYHLALVGLPRAEP